MIERRQSKGMESVDDLLPMSKLNSEDMPCGSRLSIYVKDTDDAIHIIDAEIFRYSFSYNKGYLVVTPKFLRPDMPKLGEFCMRGSDSVVGWKPYKL